MFGRKKRFDTEESLRQKVILKRDDAGVVYVKCPKCTTTVIQLMVFNGTTPLPNQCPYCNCYLKR